MNCENIFFYAQKYYKVLLIIIVVFFLLITSLLAKSNEEIVVEPVIIEKEIEKIVEVEYQKVFVDIKGEVIMPGVYQMQEYDRIIDVIDKAGGLTIYADTTLVNLSQIVRDEMIIIIPHFSDDNSKLPTVITKDDDNFTESEENGLICLNTGALNELITLPGIGESRALAIIQYREETPFTEIEEIMNVSGIGEAIFAQIKDLVKI